MKKQNLLKSFLKIPQKKIKRINKKSILFRTKLVLKRKCKLHEINLSKFNITVNKMLTGFNQKQLEFLYYFFPYWYVVKLEDRKKITYQNVSKKREEMIALAKKLSGSEMCEQWKLICDNRSCLDCDLYQADIMACATIRAKMKGSKN